MVVSVGKIRCVGLAVMAGRIVVLDMIAARLGLSQPDPHYRGQDGRAEGVYSILHDKNITKTERLSKARWLKEVEATK